MRGNLETTVLDKLTFENLPSEWQDFDFTRFSDSKKLYDFQQNALKNAAKVLYLYFKDKNASKESLSRYYRLLDLDVESDCDFKVRQDSKSAAYLLKYPEDYPVTDGKIPFVHFINRMSFWMATGSGKTLVIVKLIELLGKLIRERELPEGDILFLAHRDDLLDQFKNHVDEFNCLNFDMRINLQSLKDYDSIKRDNMVPYVRNEITVFYYRSDLISDEHKEKTVDFRKYDNEGKWYILLDEAHKGDREESKRQILYSILSRNGFLFNFSATFTDPRDFLTCAFNFNLSKFVQEGYSKHIYVSSSDIGAFRNKDFSEADKQKIVLKTLLLLTYIGKHYEDIRSVDSSLYHRPLLLTLVNSVDTKDSDLELFFRELEKIAKNRIRPDLLDMARHELVNEFNGTSSFQFEDIACKLDNDLLLKLDYKDVLKYVFNSETSGNIEILKIPGNKNELVFKLKTAERPFALIKIGDISGWLKDKLGGYEINESFENESYFRQINSDDSDINILMGSRSFYEGWDSNRPNVLLFINIGVGSDARKFVLQSIGRGVRIEPKRHHRRRIQYLVGQSVLEEFVLRKIRDLVLPVESLFILGTNAGNLREIIETLKTEKQHESLGNMFIVNPVVQDRVLLVPVYKTTEKLFAEESTPQKFPISREDLNMALRFYEFLGDKVTLVRYDCDVRVLKRLKNSFSKSDKYFLLDEHSILNPDLVLGRILRHLGLKGKKLDGFKKLENEIVHFKSISVDREKYEKIKQTIERVKSYPKKLQEALNELSRSGRKEKIMFLKNEETCEIKGHRLRIKYLANHYYIPVILSESEKIDYINHIITVDSEVKFLIALEDYLGEENNVFSKFDWWMFSKLDASLDKVSIPYYHYKSHKIENFKPDFIFWLQKGNRYLILFVDPKGTEHTEGLRKVNLYTRIFETESETVKDFPYGDLIVNVKLLLKPAKGDISAIPEPQRRLWFDDFTEFAEKIDLF